jgi:hypothetical protein
MEGSFVPSACDASPIANHVGGYSANAVFIYYSPIVSVFSVNRQHIGPDRLISLSKEKRKILGCLWNLPLCSSSTGGIAALNAFIGGQRIDDLSDERIIRNAG